jgi:hypothetical protein
VRLNLFQKRPVSEGEGGPYGALAARGIPEGLGVLFMPSLASLLDRAEDLKGSPLTEVEVVRIRDEARVVVTPMDVVTAVEASRGYPEVDVLDAWESWQALRVSGSPVELPGE